MRGLILAPFGFRLELSDVANELMPLIDVKKNPYQLVPAADLQAMKRAKATPHGLLGTKVRKRDFGT